MPSMSDVLFENEYGPAYHKLSEYIKSVSEYGMTADLYIRSQISKEENNRIMSDNKLSFQLHEMYSALNVRIIQIEIFSIFIIAMMGSFIFIQWRNKCKQNKTLKNAKVVENINNI